MKMISTRQDQGIPGVYGLLLLDIVSRWGYSDETLFAPFHLSSEQLADPNYRIPTEVANEMLKYSLHLSEESTLGYHIGTQMRISIHGFIGYAIMTAHDITDAVALASRFIQLRLPFLQLHFSTFGPKATLQLQCDINIEPLRSEIVLGLSLGILTMAKALTGVEDLSAEIDLDFPEPQGFDKYRDKISSQIRFNQPHLIASFDKKYLGLKMVNADPIASQVAINQCETELSALGERRRLAMRVRDILDYFEDFYQDFDVVRAYDMLAKLSINPNDKLKLLSDISTNYINGVSIGTIFILLKRKIWFFQIQIHKICGFLQTLLVGLLIYQ